MLLKISSYCSKILHKSFGIKILFQKNSWIKENVLYIFKLEIWTNSFVSLIRNKVFWGVLYLKLKKVLDEDISITKLEFFLKKFNKFSNSLLNL
jgi:hypothetical protein